jgi:hypothetical protein
VTEVGDVERRVDEATVAAPEWTERMWDDVWERTLGPVDRHRLAQALLRREQPQDRLALRVLPELARRWRRACTLYALGWGAFATFWVVIGVAAESGPEGAAVVTPWWMGMLGLAVVAVALVLRFWIRDMAGPPPGG